MAKHFENKSAFEHVLDARKKGAIATSEIHGKELSCATRAFLFSTQEISFLLPILAIIFSFNQIFYPLLFLVGWTFWKTSFDIFRSWIKLGRLHRLIEEERWEIEHHRLQEKEELKALYAARGFDGKLLDEVIEVLMADDNRLLQVMLEEELGLTLESYDHPLKIGFYSMIASLGFGSILLFSLMYLPFLISFFFAVLLIAVSAMIQAKKERHSMISTVVWSVACFLLAVLTVIFLRQQYVSSLPL